jgi:outer membrane protein OmpA-like peptidoglycan-associated protein
MKNTQKSLYTDSMKIIFRIAYVFLLATSTVANAQNIMTHLSNHEKKGDKMFYNFSYKSAVADYLVALKNDPEKNHLKLKIAECYRMLNEPAQSEDWYAQAINSNVALPQHKLHYADALSSNKKYEEAKRWYAQYQEEVSTDSRSVNKIGAIDNISGLFRDSAYITVKPVTINSPEADFSPAFFSEGIVFVSARDQHKSVKRTFTWNQSHFLDLYYGAVDKQGTFATPQLFHKNVNTDLHEGPTVFYEGGKKMVFTRNNLLNGKISKSRDGIVKLEIYFSELTGDVWSKPTPFSFNNEEYSVGHPAISADGSTLYFVSDMPGGVGGTDIYKCVLQNETWSKPENLGTDVNTEGNEIFPFCYQDNELYFSSNGLGGLGGLDIFSLQLSNKEITNIGAPINSSLDDFGLIMANDGATGYFASNRKGSAGDDDIYRFEMTTEQVEIIVVDKETGIEIPNASVRLANSGATDQTSATNESGLATFAINPRKKYTIQVEKEFYQAAESVIDPTQRQDNETLTIKIPLDKLEEDIVSNVVEASRKETIGGGTVDLGQFGNISSASAKTSTASQKQGGDEAKGSRKIKVYQLVNISGVVQELLSVNQRTYLIDNDERALLNLDGQMVTHWEIDLPLKANQRKAAIREYLSSLGFATEFVEIHNIYYDYNKSVVRNDAVKDLDMIVMLLRENPDLNIVLGSHTDSRGSMVYNNSLADKRATAASDYLVRGGVSAGRIGKAAFGETQLINAKATVEAAHQVNRRTEFRLRFFSINGTASK